MANDSDSIAPDAVESTPKEQFLATFEREHATTLRVLRAFPTERLDLRPHPTSRNARELAWVFVLERYLGMTVYKDEFADKMSQGGAPPPPPEKWEDLLSALEQAHREFAELIRATPDEQLTEKVRFMTAPKTIGEISRIEWLRFILSDEIHHRGQFSVYLRMAGGKVPAIYGPSGDEPWI